MNNLSSTLHETKIEVNTAESEVNTITGVNVITGAPGVNLIDADIITNTLNVFFYRFEPSGLNAGAGIGDIHWMKVFCIITAFGFDQSDDRNLAGINELNMLAHVMRLFQEEPIKIFKDINDKDWHIQFIPRPLADEQINQIWSTQGSLVYRPSIAYEIALAPIEPEIPTAQAVAVTSIGTVVGTNINNRDTSWPNAQPNFLPLSASVDITNPQWAPIIVILTGGRNNRRASLNLNLKLKDINNIPSIDLWIAGDESEDINIVGQLLKTSSNDTKANKWEEIILIKSIKADVQKIDLNELPLTVVTILEQNSLNPWIGIDTTHDSFKLQLFAERQIVRGDTKIKIRSNPTLITVTKEES
ncbi:MAG: DUF4255 domain-containing protein [Alcanivoracaceae bacterium]|nr:DUF4255 domain-containing protein [Alcanivoracaceae bacterium]